MRTTDRVIGNWPSVLTACGVDERSLSGKHGPCPMCAGRDRFRFDDKDGRGTYYCSQCGPGDGFKFLEKLKGWSFKESANKIDSILGAVAPKSLRPQDDTPKRRQRLNALRPRIISLEKSDQVIGYLKNRGISINTIAKITGALGYLEDAEYYDQGRLLGQYPAMVARVMHGDQPTTFHLTFLDDIHKAKLNPNRKILSPVRSIKGGAVQLMKFTKTLGIAEGIETALSACELFNVPTWAALNANNLENFDIPAGVSDLHIFSDNDRSYTGQKAAVNLAWKANRQGIRTIVHTPEETESDWNDFLVKQSRQNKLKS